MTEQIFMNIVTACIVLAPIVWLLRVFFKDFPFLLPKHEKYSYKEIMLMGLQDKDIRRRFLITISLVLLYKVGTFIPLPGLNSWELYKFFSNIKGVAGGKVSFFSSGIVNNFSIFSLGLRPFISSCLLMQLLALIIPPLKNFYYKREESRIYFSRHTFVLTIAMVLMRSYFIGVWMTNPTHFYNMSIIAIPEVLFKLLTIITLTSATVLLLWLANMITKYGIGNGISMIVIIDIIMRIIDAGHQLGIIYSRKEIDIISIIIFSAFTAAFIWGVFYLTSIRIKMPIAVKTNRVIDIPLAFSLGGIVPLSFAISVYHLPITLAGFISNETIRAVANILLKEFYVGLVVEAILILFFYFLFIKLLFTAIPITDIFSRYGYVIEDFIVKKDIKRLGSQLSFMIGGFFVSLLIISNVVGRVFQLPYLISGLFGGYGILIIIGVIYDLLKQTESKLLRAKSNDNWTLINSASDEIEAIIKKIYLEDHNIRCIIEPLRFTWGMPIKTPVDEYRLYVPKEKSEEAKNCLLDKVSYYATTKNNIK